MLTWFMYGAFLLLSYWDFLALEPWAGGLVWDWEHSPPGGTSETELSLPIYRHTWMWDQTVPLRVWLWLLL